MTNELLNPQADPEELGEGKLREVPIEWTRSRPHLVPTLLVITKDTHSEFNKDLSTLTARKVLSADYEDALLTTGFALLVFASCAAFIARVL